MTATNATTSTAHDIHRSPPHSAEAEQGVLGSMLHSPRDVIGECVDRISGEYFYIPAHQTVFDVLAELWHNGQAIDLITFTQVLRDRNLLDAIGGASFVTSLYTFVPTAANVNYYLDIVRDKYVLRQIIASCTECVRRAYEEQESVAYLLDEAQAVMTRLAIGADQRDVIRHVEAGVDQVITDLDNAYHRRGSEAVVGYGTGIIDLDRMTTGFQKQQFIVVGARPSTGKTALALNMAAHMAVTDSRAIIFFSLEMSYEQIVRRLGSNIADVPLQKFRDGFLSKKDFAEIPGRLAPLRTAPIWIDDTPALTIGAFKARARRAAVQFGIKAIFVDYLQLMKSTSRRAEDNLRIEVTEISGALKATAKELNVPLICCAQLNREAEAREFGRPKLADLRESGSIEQDADIVIMLWRPSRHLESYKQREKLSQILKLKSAGTGKNLFGRDADDKLTDEELGERDDQINTYTEIIMPKQRDGPVTDEKNRIRLRFEGDIVKFQNVTKKAWSNNAAERQQIDNDELD